MYRVAVVDDEALVRSGLSLILDTAPDIEVVAACDGVTALEQIRDAHPDVVLLDIRMPDIDGLTILGKLMAEPSPPVVAMLTTFTADELVSAALRHGASGFLLKDTEPEQLINSIRVLAGGGSVLAPGVSELVLAGYVAAGIDPEARRRVDKLTEREREVLVLIGEGLSNNEISARLYLSLGTVKEYVSAVLTKVGASNRVSAAVLAHRSGLVPAP